jgi:hypothetical protein
MSDFDWNTEEKEATQAAIFEGKRMGLDSFQDVLQTDPLLLDKAIQLLNTAIDDLPDIAKHVIGVINEQAGGTWLFFHSNADIFDGAEAIFLRIEKPELGDIDPDNIEINNHTWCIMSKEPLLIRSMYNAVGGFKKTVEGIDYHTIDDGDDGWT